jgi:hypothetical protein
MYKLICETCKKEFLQSKKPHQKTCSKTCSYIRIKERKSKIVFKDFNCVRCNILLKRNSGSQKYCKECVGIARIEKQNEYNKKNKERIDKYRKIFKENYKEKARYNSRKYKKRKRNDPLFVLSNKVGCMMRDALVRKNRYKKEKHSVEYLGCSVQFLKEHLEKQWDKTMSWNNYGKYPNGWDIDHIIPLSSAKTLEELIPLLHYKNLQPLNSKYNREVKRDRLEI